MANVYDVAEYILEKRGEMTAMKLQKLCYYSHAWHLVWEEQPLFANQIEAWANGPVVRDLYRAHRGEFRVSEMPDYVKADSGNLTHDETTSIDAVLSHYGEMTGHQLSELTHSERPWRNARVGLGAGVRSETPIPDDQIAAYYDSLTSNADLT
ncbi:Panacea domain-containing protein [Marmoricola sp. RAF53]|uniref:Panacea domain-containing protein n=1 Tax=Marmoricola sp. RAF53 TaxID=3233059 RepID=UPI003F9C0F54